MSLVEDIDNDCVWVHADIYAYMERPKEERQEHLDLSQPCTEIGGYSSEARLLLAHYLKTTVPRGMKVLLCHACNNAKCSNPRHLYWGRPKENQDDSQVREKGHAAVRGKRAWNNGIKTGALSEETRRKMAKARKGRIPNPTGRNQFG